MKKSTLFALLGSILFTQFVLSQDFYSADSSKAVEEDLIKNELVKNNLLISLKFGMAVPMGDFASNDIFNHNMLGGDSIKAEGFANTGYSFGIEVEAHTKNLFLFGVHLNYANYSYDQEPFDQLIGSDTTFAGFSVGNWTQVQPLLALGIQRSTGNLGIEFKILGGISWTRSPDMLMEVNVAGFNFTVDQQRGKNISPTIGGGFAMRYQINKMFIKMFSELTATYAQIDTDTEQKFAGFTFFTQKKTIGYQINTVKSGISVGINF